MPQEYYDKRKLAKPAAGRVGVWGMLMCMALSGSFYGPHPGLNEGFGNFILAFIVVTTLMLILVLSMAELTASLPFSGGPAVFAHAAFDGSYIARCVIGYSYIASYILGSATAAVDFGTSLTIIFGTPVQVEPVWWLVVFAGCIALCNAPPHRMFWGTFFVAVAVMGTILILPPINAAAKYEWGLVVGEDSGTTLFNDNVAGFFRAAMYCTWFYLGVEIFAVMGEELQDPREDVAPAAQWSFYTFVVTAMYMIVVGYASIPIADFSAQDYPLVYVAHQLYDPDGTATWMDPVLYALAVLPNAVSFQIGMIAYSRHIYTLSRAGYLPQSLSITVTPFTSYPTPLYSMVAGSVVAYIVGIAYWYLDSKIAFVGNIVTGVSVMFNLVAYSIDMFAFVQIRRLIPTLPRPFVSPLGVPGAIVGMIGFIILFIGGVILMQEFRAGLVVLGVVLVIGAPYYWFVVLPRVSGRAIEKPFLQAHLKFLIMDASHKSARSTVGQASHHVSSKPGIDEPANPGIARSATVGRMIGNTGKTMQPEAGVAQAASLAQAQTTSHSRRTSLQTEAPPSQMEGAGASPGQFAPPTKKGEALRWAQDVAKDALGLL
ncbi:hypothetical protein M427DRAFT_68366 [Gonapodya prolifera JEL478]|uniref:Amino acid permease/ SLC12A domain-containing protein n=1 Tax=Gonapodya prolifera (strain JEL478) TaxID=1344416 RepID=A0A139AL71_GONPJ|nr:hypothetical protein M427DRAFT_68366 [Gonapodya prolifera JEL478]|eukprot:KXS17546.1 hypothetical protein M427DRAFT_68366 [Gonapodya prolifera JEL478]